YKDAYDYGKDANGIDRVITVLKEGKHPEWLYREFRMLAWTGRTGVPTGDPELVTVEGRPAVIRRQFAETSHDILRRGSSQFLNADSIRDLQNIRAIMKIHNFAFNDFQLGICADGHVILVDPMEVYDTGKWSNRGYHRYSTYRWQKYNVRDIDG